MISIKAFVTEDPNNQPAPRGLMDHVSISSGSDQTRSQKAPEERGKNIIDKLSLSFHFCTKRLYDMMF